MSESYEVSWMIKMRDVPAYERTYETLGGTNKRSRLMTKPTKWLCAQRRLRSTWASAQSDQSSLSVWRKLGSLATHWAHSEDSDQTGRMPSLIWVFARGTARLLVLSWGGSINLALFIESVAVTAVNTNRIPQKMLQLSIYHRVMHAKDADVMAV